MTESISLVSMTDPVSLLVLIALACFIFAASFLVWVWFAEKEVSILGLSLNQNLSEDLSEDNPLANSLPPQDSPFARNTFREAIEEHRFAQEVEEYALATVQRIIRKSPDLGGIVLESIEFSKDLDRIYFDISKDGKKLLENGKAYWEIHKETGKILPTIKKTADGRWLEHAKGVRQSLASTATKAGNLIISVAHIVAGVDVVRRLDDIKFDTQFLIDARKIDQVADIEVIYESTREVMHPAYSKRERIEVLKKNYRQTRRLRNQLCAEVLHRLEKVQDPSEQSIFSRWFTFQKTKDKNVIEETRNARELIFWMDFCLRMQVALAMHTGRLSAFKQATLPSQLEKLDSVVDALQECESYLSGKYKDEGISLDAELEGLKELVAQYKRHFMSKSPTDTKAINGTSEAHHLAQIEA